MIDDDTDDDDEDACEAGAGEVAAVDGRDEEAASMIPCDACGLMIRFDAYMDHQAVCAARNGGEHAPSSAAEPAEENSSAPSASADARERSLRRPTVNCEYCGMPQAFNRINAHEQACEAVHNRRRLSLSQPQPPPRPPPQPVPQPLPSQYQAAAPASSAQGRGRPMADGRRAGGTLNEVDEIEDSSGDEYSPALPASWSRPEPSHGSVEAPAGPSGYSPPSTGGLRDGNSRAAADVPPQTAESLRIASLFPHFTSLASLRRRGELTAVDYIGQFTDGAASYHSASWAGASSRQAAPRAKGRGKGAGGGKKPRNTWRHRGGRRVYFDANGRQSTGGAAFRKYQKAGKGAQKASRAT